MKFLLGGENVKTYFKLREFWAFPSINKGQNRDLPFSFKKITKKNNRRVLNRDCTYGLRPRLLLHSPHPCVLCHGLLLAVFSGNDLGDFKPFSPVVSPSLVSLSDSLSHSVSHFCDISPSLTTTSDRRLLIIGELHALAGCVQIVPKSRP